MKIVFTNGCFDVLHRGHFELLKYAKAQGDYLIVGLNSDDSIKKLKGPSRPFFPVEDRKFMLESCIYVDEVVIFEELTPRNLIGEIEPNLIVKGGDYKKEKVVGHDLAEVVIFNYIDGYSTTSILGEMNENICN
tara:strand:+ start:653 stop:1054 length:402 start_codon:yes stop_codon:yes gene_type:complete